MAISLMSDISRIKNDPENPFSKRSRAGSVESGNEEA